MTMEITENVKTHEVLDFDFMFVSGNKLTVTIDLDAGDTFVEVADHYAFDIKAKPGLLDPEEGTDAEQLKVFKAGLAAASLMKRKQRQPTEEEAFSMKRTVHALAKQIQ